MFLDKLYPNKMIASVYELNWEELSERYGGVMFDIDNTLVPHGAPATPKAIRLFERIHGLGMKTMLVSNNREARVKPFAEQVHTEYVPNRGTVFLTCIRHVLFHHGHTHRVYDIYGIAVVKRNPHNILRVCFRRKMQCSVGGIAVEEEHDMLLCRHHRTCIAVGNEDRKSVV